MELWKKLKNTHKPIVLYGMGNGADRILDELERCGLQASGVFASDGFVRHQSFRGFTVCSYAEMKKKFDEMVVLVSFGTHLTEVMDRIRELMTEQETYAPDVPVAGETIFNEAFLQQNKDAISRVYEMLADEQSKKVYECVIRSKLTGELSPLFECETDAEEGWSIINPGLNESYLDLGAYTGDTIQGFLDHTDGKYRHIIAVEPDSKNFKKLKNSVEGLHNVTLFEGCIAQSAGTRMYAMDGGRKSHSLERNGVDIPAISVDELVGKEPVTFIKMDVEGMEAEAIMGASKTICNNNLVMQIAAYHRSEDLFHLPLLIDSIRPGGAYYLRHRPCLPAWDTDFIVKF